MFDRVLCSVLWSLCRLDPVTWGHTIWGAKMVLPLALCLLPKEEEKECVMEKRNAFKELTWMEEMKQTKILKAIKLGSVYYLLVHVLFWKIW